MTERAKRKLVALVEKNRRLSSKDIALQMEDYGANVSPPTVRKILIKAGLNARRPRRKQKITATMAKKRLAWAKEHMNLTIDDWKKVRYSKQSYQHTLHKTKPAK